MRLLDLFCGAGGAAMGYHRAGFTEIVGVDVAPQPHYPFNFVQADAMTYALEGFDAIHASPPCQAHTSMKWMPNARTHVNLLSPTLARFDPLGVPWVVENVSGSPMRAAIQLCGTSFGLGAQLGGTLGYADLHRHRLFELSHPIFAPPCAHRRGKPVIGFYGDHVRVRRRSRDGGDITGNTKKLPLVKAAMGIDWMTWTEATQAIPPAYTEYIGKQLLEYLRCSVKIA